MNTKAQTLMQRDLTAVMEDDLIHDAVHILYSHNLSGIPVIREDWVLMGYLSESDVLKAALPTYLEVIAQSSFLNDEECSLLDRFKTLGNTRVSEFMNTKPIYVEPATSLMIVADLMLRKKVKRLPVVENGKLVGIIDRGAFCEFLMEADTLNEEE